jgi:hypothetical protein
MVQFKSEINSSYSDGIKLNSEKFRIPDSNNFYGILYNLDSKAELAKKFMGIGWSVRRATWVDYEIQSEFCEIIIEGHDSEPLFSGTIDPSMVDDFESILREFGLKYSVELYKNGEIVKMSSNN